MKKILSYILITTGMLILSINMVTAVFKPFAQLTNLRFKISDFVAPPVVELDTQSNIFLKSGSQVSWTAVSDYKQTSEPVYYKLSISGREYRVNDNKFFLDQESFLAGDHYFKVRACDQLNNCSNWSQEGLYKVIEPALIGDIGTFVDHYQISNINSTNFWFENYLELKIDGGFMEQLVFDYFVESSESLLGFDQAKLIVTINDVPIYIENNISNSWQTIAVNITQYMDMPMTIKFYSGNQGDRQASSWAKIKNINIFNQQVQANSGQQEIQDKLHSLGINY